MKTYLVHAVGQLSVTLKFKQGESGVEMCVEPMLTPDVNIQCHEEDEDGQEVRANTDENTAKRLATLTLSIALKELLEQYTKHVAHASEPEPSYMLPVPKEMA